MTQSVRASAKAGSKPCSRIGDPQCRVRDVHIEAKRGGRRTYRVVLEHAQRARRPDAIEGIGEARHGHGDEADGDGARFRWYIVLAFKVVAMEDDEREDGETEFGEARCD